MAGEPDPFDALLELENEFIRSGEAQGADDAGRRSYAQGFELGEERGLSVGDELGYVAGVVAALRLAAPRHPARFGPKVVRTMDRIEELLAAFRLGDAQYVKQGDDVLLVRAKFKVLVSMLGLHGHLSDSDGAPQLNF